MKKLTVLAAILALSLPACVQKTEREVSPTQTTETTTVSSTVDTAGATAAATDAARDAAHKTGTAMETAGQAIQEHTKTDTHQ